MNNRPRISSLTEKELAGLLIACFYKVGKSMKITKEETQILLDEVYKTYGGMYTDDFSDAFSKYAACVLPGSETLHPQVSFYFVGRLMKLYCNKKAWAGKTKKDIPTLLSPYEKYKLFEKHAQAYGMLPVNTDWVSIYEYLLGLNELQAITDWSSLTYAQKMKKAMRAVTDWTHQNYPL